MNVEAQIIRAAAKYYPDLIGYLSGRARWIVASAPRELDAVKTAAEYIRWLTNTVTDLYEGGSKSDFIDTMANIIQEQLTRAYNAAWKESGEELPLPDYLASALEDAVLGQYDFVDGYAADIQAAAKDGTPIDGLLSRAELWAAQYGTAQDEAARLIALENGGNLKWELGATEEHCNSCASLNGVVAPAKLWEELGVHPKDGPNDKLDCGGWRCDCKCDPTDEKATPDARSIIMVAMAQG
jgi:hypothetical protein